mmetsp:Transcript_23791/g.38588  ORF Transcript_23791/g.38588 Transcript_23791/m.38588 type:complete len:80 (-) Transcript_23791:238-477(-)
MQDIGKMEGGMDTEWPDIAMEKFSMESGNAGGATDMGYCTWQTRRCSTGIGSPTRSTASAYTTGKTEKSMSRGIKTMFD